MTAHMKVATLGDEGLSYDALSYAWGSDDLLQAIEINGHHVWVSTNLYDFLRVQTRKKTRLSLLWIDQLCINQSDLDEKAAQIALMDQIYARARKTLVWLGPDADQGAAFASIHKVARLSHDLDRLIFSKNLAVAERLAVLRLICLPYWSRHWIIQELCISRELKLCYGEKQIPWNLFAQQTFWGANSTVWTTEEDECEATEHFSRVMRLRHLMGSPSSSSTRVNNAFWYRVMVATARSKCKDPRDKVYGLQSVLADNCRIDVDYSKSVVDVYFAHIEALFHVDHGRSDLFARACLELAIGMDIAPTTDHRGRLEQWKRDHPRHANNEELVKAKLRLDLEHLQKFLIDTRRQALVEESNDRVDAWPAFQNALIEKVLYVGLVNASAHHVPR